MDFQTVYIYDMLLITKALSTVLLCSFLIAYSLSKCFIISVSILIQITFFFRTPILRPNVAIQEEMLIGGLSDILFKASEGKESVVCMLGYKDAFDTDNNYRADGYTEKVKQIVLVNVYKGIS